MLRRHWMLTPSLDAWGGLLVKRPDLAEEPLVAAWAELGFPLVLRRPLDNDPPGELPLGLPLPPSHGKKRVALTLPDQDVLGLSPPPKLADAADAAPEEWQETIARLLQIDDNTRCFGSLAWQYLTGLAYLSPSSDLDLLWALPAHPGSLLGGIAAIAHAAPMHIDGEVLGSCGAVQWRELHASVDSIVVKGESVVTLMTKDEFLVGTP